MLLNRRRARRKPTTPPLELAVAGTPYSEVYHSSRNSHLCIWAFCLSCKTHMFSLLCHRAFRHTWPQLQSSRTPLLFRLLTHKTFCKGHLRSFPSCSQLNQKFVNILKYKKGYVPTFAILATKDSSIRYIDSNFPSKPIFKVTLFAFCTIISSVVEEIAGISQLAKLLAFLWVFHTCIEHLSKLLISILLPWKPLNRNPS